MKIIERGDLTYYVGINSVIVGSDRTQYTAYTVYPLQNRKPFYDFRAAIEKSNDNEYGNPIELIALASKYKLGGAASHKPGEWEIATW